MDPLHVALAVGPLGLYLGWIGIINLRRRPTLLTGGWDTGMLALGLSGLVTVGPLELFLPEAAAARFGPWVWLLMLGLYVSAVTLYVITAPIRVIVYNANPEQLRRMLGELMLRLDGDSRWAGNTALLPQLGVHLHVESLALMRNVSLIAVQREQSLAGWSTLIDALSEVVREVAEPPNPRGYLFLSCAITMLTFVAWQVTLGREQLAENFRDLLRM